MTLRQRGSRKQSDHEADRAERRLVPAKGSVEVNGIRIDARDGAAIRDESTVRVTAIDDAELVLVDAA